jgi:hypothetical protein
MAKRLAYANPRARMCLNKARFNRRGAQQRAHKYGLRSYHCPVCSQWHLSRQSEEPA